MINKSIKQAIFYDFLAWIEGIQEETPLSNEIKNIYFILEFAQNDVVLSYSGDDKNLVVFDYGAYFPLEAQYFFSLNLKQLAKQVFEHKKNLKDEIFEMLKDVVFSASKQLFYLCDKNIFFGFRFDTVLRI